MPDEIGWPTPEEERMLDRAQIVADRDAPATEASKAETARRCEEARLYRIEREKRRKS